MVMISVTTLHNNRRSTIEEIVLFGLCDFFRKWTTWKRKKSRET